MVIEPRYNVPLLPAASPPRPTPVTASPPSAPPAVPMPAAASPDLQFSVDTETGKTVVRVVDPQTHEVIRQIPDEELLAIAKSLSRLEAVLVRERA